MSPHFYNVGHAHGNVQYFMPHQNSGYYDRSYENYRSVDVYSGNISKNTQNWMIAGLGLQVLGNVLGHNDPDTGRILSSAGYVASGVGNIKMMGDMDQYHERVYNYGNESSNWYNYNSGSWNNGWNNGWNSGWSSSGSYEYESSTSWGNDWGHRGRHGHGHHGHHGNSAVDALNDWNYWPGGSTSHSYERYGWNNQSWSGGGTWPWICY